MAQGSTLTLLAEVAIDERKEQLLAGGLDVNSLVNLTLLHVVDVDKLAYRMIPDFQIEMVRENAGKAGQHVLDSKVAILEEAGFIVEARLDFGLPRQSICKIANDESFQLMIIGRRESTGEIRDVLFGSVANYVLHNVACPVLLF